jgi:hypothetical protein
VTTWSEGFTSAVRGNPLPDDATVMFRLGYGHGLEAGHQERREIDRMAKDSSNYTAPEGYADDPAFD